jgi:methyl-accepting chemotaxis protein
VARAGDAGRGSAMVANEVKSLANQTARATTRQIASVSDEASQTEGPVSAVLIPLVRLPPPGRHSARWKVP